MEQWKKGAMEQLNNRTMELQQCNYVIMLKCDNVTM